MTCIHLKVRQCTCARAPTFNRAVPSIVCGQCAHYEGPARGVGDIVHTLATVTGLAAINRVVRGNCGKCAKRRIEMNTRYPS